MMIWSPVMGLSPCGGRQKEQSRSFGLSIQTVNSCQQKNPEEVLRVRKVYQTACVPEAGFTMEAVEGSGSAAGYSWFQ
jgi:hypothetical protein